MPNIFTALRLWTFSASLTPVILGATLSYRTQGDFSLTIFILTLGAVLAVNGAGNMVNSYFDCMRKLESATSRASPNTKNKLLEDSGLERTQLGTEGESKDIETSSFNLRAEGLTGLQLDQSALVNYAAYLYGFGMLCMLLLMVLSTGKSESIAALFFGGLSSSFLYTGGVGLKYYILGDLLVVFTFGPLSMLFSFGVQSGQFSLSPLLLALPLALSTETILHSKHLRELEEDKKEGIISLAVLLGKQGSYVLFTFLLFSPFLLFAVFATRYSIFLGLPLLSLPYAFKQERMLRDEGPSKATSVRAAKLNVIVSVLFILGVLKASHIPFVPDNA